MTLYAAPASLNADAYKSGHIYQYPAGTKFLFFNMTPRSDKYLNTPLFKDGAIAFGIKRFCQDYLRDHWNATFFKQPKQQVVDMTLRIMNGVLGEGAVGREHWEALHDLGYLPISVDAVPEGTLLPIKVPMVAFMPTHKDFAWVAGYLEDAFSNELWKATTIATVAFHNRRIAEQWAEATCDNNGHVPWQFHDFALRGLSGMNDGAFNSVGHLTSFKGTDNFAAVYTADRVYGEGMPVSEIGNSIPATEHSVMTANIAVNIHKYFGTAADTTDDYQRYIGERMTFEDFLVNKYPSGLLSLVADSYNFWRTIGTIAADLKDIIMAREGKLVFRPDSGNPFHVICGYKAVNFEIAKADIIKRVKRNAGNLGSLNIESIENAKHPRDLPYLKEYLGKDKGYELIVWDEDFDGMETYNIETSESKWMSTEEVRGSIVTLYSTFGGTKNSKGYLEIDPHVGLIYGDSITMELAQKIFARMAEMGFASSNIVFGIGSFAYQFNTRDTLGFAVKATDIETDFGEIPLSKDPITDMGLKKSAHGCVIAVKDETIVAVDGLTRLRYEDLVLNGGTIFETYFHNGVCFSEDSLATIRKRIDKVI